MSTDRTSAADEDATERLRAWLAEQIDGDGHSDGDVRVEGLDRVDVGHSAEMLTLLETDVPPLDMLLRDDDDFRARVEAMEQELGGL